MTARLDAAERLRRLLAVLGWLARVGEAPLSVVAERFAMEPDQLVAELELAACCGLPPYTPDQLMEIIVTDETVSARLGPSLAQPRRLSEAEGFALALSARTILAVPGADTDGVLARALDKLEAVLGAQHRLHVELDEPTHLPALQAALGGGQQVELTYLSASADEETVRRVDPNAVFARDGHWYLDGYCHRAGGDRRFRVDRIRDVSVVGPVARDVGPGPVAPDSGDGPVAPDSGDGPVAPGVGARDVGPGPVAPDVGAPGSESALVGAGRFGAPGGGESPFLPGADALRVRLHLQNAAAWVAETYPVSEVVNREDGSQEVVLAVGGRAWLARLLLRLGPDASVLDPPELADVGAQAAERILARYRIGSATASS